MLKWVTLLHKYKLCKICPGASRTTSRHVGTIVWVDFVNALEVIGIQSTRREREESKVITQLSFDIAPLSAAPYLAMLLYFTKYKFSSF